MFKQFLRLTMFLIICAAHTAWSGDKQFSLTNRCDNCEYFEINENSVYYLDSDFFAAAIVTEFNKYASENVSKELFEDFTSIVLTGKYYTIQLKDLFKNRIQYHPRLKRKNIYSNGNYGKKEFIKILSSFGEDRPKIVFLVTGGDGYKKILSDIATERLLDPFDYYIFNEISPTNIVFNFNLMDEFNKAMERSKKMNQ